MAKDGSAAQDQALAELVADAPCGIVLTDPEGRLLYANETLHRWTGMSPVADDSLQRLPDLMTLPGRLFYETHIAPMMQLQGFAREISCALRVQGGAPLPVLLSGVARHDASGNPTRYDYTIFDMRERRVYEDELRTAQKHADELAAIVRSSPNAILRVDDAGLIRSWNRSAERLFGHTGKDVMGRAVLDIVHFADHPDWFTHAVEICRTEPEAVLEPSGAHGHDFEITVVPIESDDLADPSRSYSVILRDISQRRKVERRLQVAMGEMKHRVKNTLAVVSGIARQSLPSELRDEFIGRLHALSRAHDVLTDEGVKGADLRDLLALTAEEAGGPTRFRVSGPSVPLSAAQASSLSMALHELTTNALKYGALSERGGYVQVDFDHGVASPGRVRLVWQERDGPSVTPPQHHGFGSKMINRVLAVDIDAQVEFDYRPDGIVCAISFDA
ncbi:hypothetical protein ATO2_12085 [Roseovarius sp. 22II1-1F6A]|nr:hypothetical protein ATO2_12085 [Roseovarius sp. 22II1-1F6A]